MHVLLQKELVQSDHEWLRKRPKFGVFSALCDQIELIPSAMRHKCRLPTTYYSENVENPLFKEMAHFQGG
jgi:hypothetical protein